MFYLEQVLNALVIGTIYALMAVGLSLIFGVLKLVNFSHGQMLMLGGYLYLVLAKWLGLTPVPGLLLCLPILYGFGLAVEWTLIRTKGKERIPRYDEYVTMATFALGLFLQNVALPLFGPYNKQAPALFKLKVQVGNLAISGDRLAAAITAFVVISALVLFLYRTYAGKALRAVAQNPFSAAIVGINVIRTQRMAFALGATLSGASGALLGSVFLVHPDMGLSFAIKAFVIVVLGGMGSIWGSVLGAYLLALVESLGSVFIPDMTRALAYKDAYGLLLLILILLLRPQGLFGEKGRRA